MGSVAGSAPEEAQTGSMAAQDEDPMTAYKRRMMLQLLDEWYSRPDDLGDEWWDEFRRELMDNRLNVEHREQVADAPSSPTTRATSSTSR